MLPSLTFGKYYTSVAFFLTNVWENSILIHIWKHQRLKTSSFALLNWHIHFANSEYYDLSRLGIRTIWSVQTPTYHVMTMMVAWATEMTFSTSEGDIDKNKWTMGGRKMDGSTEHLINLSWYGFGVVCRAIAYFRPNPQKNLCLYRVKVFEHLGDLYHQALFAEAWFCVFVNNENN